MNYPYYGQYMSYPQNPQMQTYPSQKIQTLSSSMSTDAQIFYVNASQDMEKVNPQPNVLYVGINLAKKEIYLRQMNGMGLIDLDTYVRQSGEQQKNDVAKILERIDQLETNMKGKKDVVQSSNDSVRNEYADKRNVKKSPSNATIQSID